MIQIDIDMKMPEKCGMCRFTSAMDCGITGKFIEDHDTVPNHCPLKEVPTGKWIHKQMDSFYHIIGQCSNCKSRYRLNNYCPNCGAKMMVEKQQRENNTYKGRGIKIYKEEMDSEY